jgi:hypothetical protein
MFTPLAHLSICIAYTRFVGFHVLAAVLTKSFFWDVTSCRPLEVNWRLRQICRLYIQGGGRNQYVTSSKQYLCTRNSKLVTWNFFVGKAGRPLEVNWRFRQICSLYIQGRGRNQNITSCKQWLCKRNSKLVRWNLFLRKAVMSYSFWSALLAIRIVSEQGHKNFI